MKTKGLFWIFLLPVLHAQAQVDGIHAMIYSGAPLKINYIGDNFDGLSIKEV